MRHWQKIVSVSQRTYGSDSVAGTPTMKLYVLWLDTVWETG